MHFLLQEETKQKKRQSDTAEIPKNIKEIDENSVDDSSDDSSEEPKVHFKLPLQLDFDDLAGSLIAKNQRLELTKQLATQLLIVRGISDPR